MPAPAAAVSTIDVAVVEGATHDRLLEHDVGELLERGVGDAFAEHAGGLDHAPVGEHVHVHPPGEEPPGDAHRRDEEDEQQPPHPRRVGQPPRLEQDDQGEDGGGEEDPLDHLGDEEHPVMPLGVQDPLGGAELLLDVLDAHMPLLARCRQHITTAILGLAVPATVGVCS